MELTFLGTSAGTPTRARNVTGLALQHGGPRHWYLVDCGEGTQHQLLRTRLSVMQLQAIFISHVHGDHTFGLPGLLSSASMNGRTTPLPIIGPPQLRNFLKSPLPVPIPDWVLNCSLSTPRPMTFTGRTTPSE